MSVYFASCNDLSYRIHDLQKQILDREHEMCATEARVLYEDLITVHETLVKHENTLKTTCDGYTSTDYFAKDMRNTHLMTTNLKIKLTKILSTFELKSSAEAKQSLQIRKQRSLIKGIESLEIHDDICAIKAEILNSNLSQLYDSFNLNQTQIEADIDDDVTLGDQIKIATEIRRKVIDFQTKLKKIMQSTSSTESIRIDRSIQPTQTDTRVNLDTLFQKRESLIKRVNALEPKEDLCPEKAEVMHNYLNSLYESFNSNQTKIELLVSGETLDNQLEISEQIQNKIIELQAKFKQIFAPIKLSSSTDSEELQSQQIKSSEFEKNLQSIELKLTDLTDFLKSQLSRVETENNNNIYSHLEDNSELSKDIQNKIISLQTSLNTFVGVNENHDKNALNKLDKILQINQRLEQDYKTKTLPSLSKSESNIRAIEQRLSSLTTLCKDLPVKQENNKNFNKIINFLNDYILKTCTDIQTKMNKFLDADKSRTAILQDIQTRIHQTTQPRNSLTLLQNLNFPKVELQAPSMPYLTSYKPKK